MITIVFNDRLAPFNALNPEEDAKQISLTLHKWVLIKQAKLETYLVKENNSVSISCDIHADISLSLNEVYAIVLNIISGKLHLHYYIALIQMGNLTQKYDEDIRPLLNTNELLKGKTGQPLIRQFPSDLTYEKLCAVLAPADDERNKLRNILRECHLPEHDFSAENLAKALRRIAQYSTSNKILILRKFGVDPNARDSNPKKGYTALHVAVAECKCDNVRELIAIGAHLIVTDCNGKTPLQHILESNNQEVRQLALFNQDKFNEYFYQVCHINEVIDAQYISLVFHAINQVTLKYPSKVEKIELLLRQNLKFYITTQGFGTVSGQYRPDRNEIYFY